MIERVGERYNGEDELLRCPPETYAAECRRLGREAREADAADAELCDDLQRVYRRDFRRDVAVVLLVWCWRRGFAGGEFARGVMSHLDSRGSALRLWFESIGARMWYVKWKDWIGADRHYYEASPREGDAAALERLYEKGTALFEVTVEHPRCGSLRVDLRSAVRASDWEPTLRNPVVLAAFLRTVTKDFLYALARDARRASYPDWEAMPHGRRLRRFVSLLGADTRTHRECDYVYRV